MYRNGKMEITPAACKIDKTMNETKSKRNFNFSFLLKVFQILYKTFKFIIRLHLLLFKNLAFLFKTIHGFFIKIGFFINKTI